MSMEGLTPVLPVGGNGDNCYGNGIGALIGGVIGGAVGGAWNGNRWNGGNSCVPAAPVIVSDGHSHDSTFLMDGITATNSNLGSVGRDVLIGIQGLQMANCQGFGGLNTEIVRGQSRTEAAVYTTALQGQLGNKDNTIASINATHANEVAMLTGFNTLQASQKDCCCQTQQNIKELEHTVADEACKTRGAIHAEGEATRALISALDREKLLRENAALNAEIGSLKSQQFTAGVVAANNQSLKCDMQSMMNQVVATMGIATRAYDRGRTADTAGTATPAAA